MQANTTQLSDDFEVMEDQESFCQLSSFIDQQKETKSAIKLQSSIEQKTKTENIDKKDDKERSTLNLQTFQNYYKKNSTNKKEETFYNDYLMTNQDISIIKPKDQYFENKIQESQKQYQQLQDKLDYLQQTIQQSFSNIQKSILHKKTYKNKICLNQQCYQCKQKIYDKIYTCTQCVNFFLCRNCVRNTQHNHTFIRSTSTIENDKLKMLRDVLMISEFMKNAKAIEIKNKILRNITKNEYEEEFYESMVNNYSQYTLEDFILEVIVIFNNQFQ